MVVLPMGIRGLGIEREKACLQWVRGIRAVSLSIRAHYPFPHPTHMKLNVIQSMRSNMVLNVAESRGKSRMRIFERRMRFTREIPTLSFSTPEDRESARDFLVSGRQASQASASLPPPVRESRRSYFRPPASPGCSNSPLHQSPDGIH